MNLTGQTLGDYQVLRRLGRGAMAEVYLAEQASLGRQVALKILNADLARDANYVSRFKQEARSAAALVHGNIVQIYEVGVGHTEGNGDESTGGDWHFIAQEYVAGRNVGELIKRQGRLSPGLVLDILRQVTAALCRASEASIVHRDIKPENLMLARSGEVKVADFGLARAMQADGNGQEASRLTQVGITMGTPLYMSPEQVEGKSLDLRSDLYSLGVSAYHMLCGEPPFTGETPLSVAVQHLNTTAESLVDRQPDAPAALCQIIAKLMNKQPAERYDSPQALLAELRQLATQAAAAGWAEGPQDWSMTAALGSVALDDSAATRLAQLMQQEKTLRAATSWGRWQKLASVAIACLVGGAIFAAISRPTALLAGAEQGPAIKADIRSQLFHAKLVDTEAAWRAVGERFPAPPADPYYHRLAQQGLVRYYLQRQQFDQAHRLCRELADLGDGQTDFRLFGLAGLVVCDAAVGDMKQAERSLDALNASQPDAVVQLEKSDPAMKRMLDAARQQMRSR